MKRRLIFVHGRSQEHKDAQDLKDEWISALRAGLAKSNKKLPIPEADVRFPYYGQAPYDLVHDAPPDEVAEIIVKGSKDEARRAFTESILNEVRRKLGVTDEEVIDIAGGDVVQKGLQNKPWVLAIFRAIDKHVPGGSGAIIASVTNDVYQYIRNPGVRDRIDEGVQKAFSVNDANVVVSHSLGTIVAYALIGREGKAANWQVPFFMTLGSPLAITMIKDSLKPIKTPGVVGHWVNALDVKDVVALYPLDRKHFNVKPAIENLGHVSNQTSNHHGISGYLEDETVAARICAALTHRGADTRLPNPSRDFLQRQKSARCTSLLNGRLNSTKTQNKFHDAGDDERHSVIAQRGQRHDFDVCVSSRSVFAGLPYAGFERVIMETEETVWTDCLALIGIRIFAYFCFNYTVIHDRICYATNNLYCYSGFDHRYDCRCRC